MSDLMTGKGTREDYVALVAQHFFVSEALEAAGPAYATDPEAMPILSDQLTRLPALEADLSFLLGESWRDAIAPLPTTVRYVARINEIAAEHWAGGFVAHHYTRYLGDLSGGQAIASLVARHYGATPDQLGFYRFEIADDGIVRYKRGYREAMNALALSPAEVDVLIDEVRTSFRMNSAIFEALAD
jgi:heme oxygenase